MRVLVTGASGRIGRAIYGRLLNDGHQAVGLDAAPSSVADVVASLQDKAVVAGALRGADAVVHIAALHAPHVGHRSDAEFEAINVTATESLLRLAMEAGVGRFVFTSTTALYGASGHEGRAAWITEETTPRPRTIYHRTKLAAEELLERAAARNNVAITALRMSRCFPEPAPLMAAYRLHRGIDARDVADAHVTALSLSTRGFQRYVISGATPFVPDDAAQLFMDAPAVLRERAPSLVEAFAQRGWDLPARIDRVYDSSRAQAELGWVPKQGFSEVLAELDRGSSEVLPRRHGQS